MTSIWEDQLVLCEVLPNRSNNASAVAGETVPGNRTDILVPLIELRPHLQKGIVLGKLLCGCWLDLSCLMCVQGQPMVHLQLWRPCLVHAENNTKFLPFCPILPAWGLCAGGGSDRKAGWQDLRVLSLPSANILSASMEFLL